MFLTIKISTAFPNGNNRLITPQVLIRQSRGYQCSSDSSPKTAAQPLVNKLEDVGETHTVQPCSLKLLD